MKTTEAVQAQPTAQKAMSESELVQLCRYGAGADDLVFFFC
jgi:hypothetical protein